MIGFLGCLFAMFWWTFCMVVGAFLLGGWGIILGAVVAALTTRKSSMGGFEWVGAGGMEDDDDLAERREAFSRVAFAMSGHVAKADGQVTEEEIRCAEAVMEELGLSPERRSRAVRHFRLGTRPDFDPRGSLEELAHSCRKEPSLIATFLEIQVAMACADGELSPLEERILLACCHALGVPEDRLRAIIKRYLGQGREANSAPDVQEGLDWAYATLEIERSASVEEAQRAYARKMRDFHPDKLASKGLPKEFMEFATERTKRFTKAYQIIKKAKRGSG